ncbi:hypothetical protein [Acinetobacter sp. 826659]|uniref:hypothetical protein n=1 Tax=Acinetobacter sp. 826659 TaxID=1310764 RepID=UPI000453209D|nr:hypothetical protein [Acinetobacter sp. 826659]EXS35238.1 hypothetical protein J663_1149 [Acinetobacter sp. 826659]
MNKKADYTIIGCKDEAEFIKLLSNQYLYKDIIKSSIQKLDPEKFENQEDYYSRCADFENLMNRYLGEFEENYNGAEFHWYFLEGLNAFFNEHYLPALLSLICGIEASLRSTLHLISNSEVDRLYIPENMNKQMIITAKQKGLPISALAFRDEYDFHEKLSNNDKLNLLKLRNDLMHGNISEFTKSVNDERIFYPIHLLNSLIEIILISKKWLKDLNEFKSKF